MTTFTKTTLEKKAFGLNPFAKKYSNAQSGTKKSVTAFGIVCKSVVYLTAIVLGIFFAFYLHQLPTASSFLINGNAINNIECYVAIGALIAMIVAPLVAFFARITAPITGCMFCAGVGYLYTFFANVFEEFKGIILFSMIITAALFVAINLIYMSGIIKIGSKFKSVVSISVTTMVIASFALLVCSFIPAFNSSIAFVTLNPLLSIVFSVLGIIISVLFMINSIDEAHKAIDNKISKKYEWSIAFSLIFSIIWMFLEITSLVARLFDK